MTLTLPVSRRMALGALLLVASAILVALASSTGPLARATAATRIADDSDLSRQLAAAERDVERSYEQASTQVRKVRAVKLAITEQQADAVANKALSDLRTLRHSAFVSLGLTFGAGGSSAEAHASIVEKRFDDAPVSAGQSPEPVLLAPRLYAIVLRMSQLSVQLSDQATKDLTEVPSASPSPATSPRPTGRP